MKFIKSTGKRSKTLPDSLMEPYFFLTVDEVIEIHEQLIAMYGGQPGLRDRGLLDSALAMPQAMFAGKLLHCDPFEMAAAYLFHLVQNHPFLDGNKRIGTATALVFLKLNGFSLNADPDELESLVMKVACGEIEKTQIAVFFREYSERHPERLPPL